MKKLTKKTTTVDSSENILDDIGPEERGEGEEEGKEEEGEESEEERGDKEDGKGDGDGDGEVGFPGVYPLM